MPESDAMEGRGESHEPDRLGDSLTRTRSTGGTDGDSASGHSVEDSSASAAGVPPSDDDTGRIQSGSGSLSSNSSVDSINAAPGAMGNQYGSYSYLMRIDEHVREAARRDVAGDHAPSGDADHFKTDTTSGVYPVLGNMHTDTDPGGSLTEMARHVLGTNETETGKTDFLEGISAQSGDDHSATLNRRWADAETSGGRRTEPASSDGSRLGFDDETSSASGSSLRLQPSSSSSPSASTSGSDPLLTGFADESHSGVRPRGATGASASRSASQSSVNIPSLGYRSRSGRGRYAPSATDQQVLARMLFDQSSDAMYVFDRGAGRFLDVNPAFCRLVGHPASTLTDGTVTLADLVVDPAEDPSGDEPSDDSRSPGTAYIRRDELLNKLTQPDAVPDEDTVRLFHVYLRTPDNSLRQCEVSIQSATFGGKPITLGVARDVTDLVRHQEMLAMAAESSRQEAQLERQRTRQSIEANIRIMQVTERIIRTPRFTKELEGCVTTREVVARAVRYLASRRGMEFRRAAVYVREPSQPEYLRLQAESPTGSYPQWLSAEDAPHVVQATLDDAPHEAFRAEGTEDIAVPLRVGGRTRGALVAANHSAIERLVAPEESVRRTLLEVLVTLTDLVGARLHNLDLIDRLRRQAIIDDLTGVYNRRYFDQRLQVELDRARRHDRDVTLIVMDIDMFKLINDSRGHPQGDQLLREFARVLRDNVRSADVICRLGGDEFAIILPETTLDQGGRLAEKLRRIIGAHPFRNMESASLPLHVTISIGIASGVQGSITAERLYKKADTALYVSKESGRNCVSKE